MSEDNSSKDNNEIEKPKKKKKDAYNDNDRYRTEIQESVEHD